MAVSVRLKYVINKTIHNNGKDYLLGSAGSLIIACQNCGEEHFREPPNYFDHPEWHKCFTCTNPSQQMVPIDINELETKWKPFWRKLGHTINE